MNFFILFQVYYYEFQKEANLFNFILLLIQIISFNLIIPTIINVLKISNCNHFYNNLN